MKYRVIDIVKESPTLFYIKYYRNSALVPNILYVAFRIDHAADYDYKYDDIKKELDEGRITHKDLMREFCLSAVINNTERESHIIGYSVWSERLYALIRTALLFEIDLQSAF